MGNVHTHFHQLRRSQKRGPTPGAQELLYSAPGDFRNGIPRPPTRQASATTADKGSVLGVGFHGSEEGWVGLFRNGVGLARIALFSGLPSVFKGRNAVRVPPWAHIFRQAGAPTASSPADSVNILSAVARMASSSCVIIVGRFCSRILPFWIQRGCASYSFIARSGPSDMTVLELGEWDCADLLSCDDHD